MDSFLIAESLSQWVIQMVAGGFFSWLPYILCVLLQWGFQFGITVTWEWAIEEALWMVDVMDYNGAYWHSTDHFDGDHTCKFNAGSIGAYPSNKLFLVLKWNDKIDV